MGISTSGSVLVGSSVSVLACISVVIIMAVAILVECDIQPFDLLECESEVVCGYMVDYGGVLFMILYLSAGVIFAVLILVFGCAFLCSGGRIVSAVLGILLVLYSLIILRYSIPRLRMDQAVYSLLHFILGYCVLASTGH